MEQTDTSVGKSYAYEIKGGVPLKGDIEISGSGSIAVQLNCEDGVSSIGVDEWLTVGGSYFFLNNSDYGMSYVYRGGVMQDVMQWYKDEENDSIGGTFVIHLARGGRRQSGRSGQHQRRDADPVLSRRAFGFKCEPENARRCKRRRRAGYFRRHGASVPHRVRVIPHNSIQTTGGSESQRTLSRFRLLTRQPPAADNDGLRKSFPAVFHPEAAGHPRHRMRRKNRCAAGSVLVQRAAQLLTEPRADIDFKASSAAVLKK